MPQSSWATRWAPLVAALIAALGLYAYAFAAETPGGDLRGQVVSGDTGAPLAGIEVWVQPRPPARDRGNRRARTDARGEFVVRRLPAASYGIVTFTEVHVDETFETVVGEGDTARVELRLKPQDPFLNLYIHRHAFLPDEDPRVALNGFRQGDAVRLRLFSVTPEALARDWGRDLAAALTPVARTASPGQFAALRSRGVELVREWNRPIRKQDAEGVFYEYERLGRQPRGLYLVSARGSGKEVLGWLLVTDLALVTKADGERVLAFTADLRTGEPAPGAEIAFYRGSALTARTVTDARGLAEAPLASGPESAPAALARRGSSLAFLRLTPYWGGRQRYRVFTYTDRPVYRPGHRVYFKGVARRLEGPGYAVPGPRDVEVEVRDEQETRLYHATVPLMASGAFAGDFHLPSEARSGQLTLRTRIDGEAHEDTFAVASYRKPEWRVDVTTPRPAYVRGERVPVSVRAEYYYGAPVVQGTVRYTVFRAPYWAGWGDAEFSEYAFEEGEGGGGYGEVVSEGETTTDADGSARLDFPTDPGGDGETAMAHRYTIEAWVEDLSGRSESGRGSVRVSAGEFTLDARPSRHVAAPGDAVIVEVRVQDLQERPAAGVSVSVTAALQEWEGRVQREKVLAERSETTGPEGIARVPIQLSETGLVQVKATAKDRRGNRVTAFTDIWVSSAAGGDFSARYPNLSVTPDRKEYRVGETAQVLVNTDRPGGTAIVSLETERLLTYRLVPLKEKSTVVRFPIHAGYEPNVHVTACFVRNREFVSSQARLNVSPQAHRLQVTVESDREVYRPGETATFQVRTTDAAGRPMAAEFSFGLVDEAIYAIRPEPARGIWEAFYPRRRNMVVTEFSYPAIYLGDADKAGAAISVRRRFPDTALWEPFLKTDAAGRAVVRAELPDNLTSWRATVAAHSSRTEVGKATHNVRVAKELTIRLQTPRVLTEGDRLTLSAVAHNYTDRPLDVRVALHASGLELQGDPARSARLGPGEAQRVTWEAAAPAAGKALLTATAAAGALSDGMELTVPVRPFARPRVEGRTGVVDEESAVETFRRESTAVDGALEIRLAPTLAGSLLGALEYLASYPYGCTEQTMSSFLPNVLLTRTFRDLGIRNPGLEARLPEMTRAGLLRLYGFQNMGGGWGWWEHDAGDPWMTGYVLFGIGLARDAGIEVNRQIYESGLAAAGEMSRQSDTKPDDAMFLAYVLAHAGQRETAGAILKGLDAARPKLSTRSRAYAALALAAMRRPEDRVRAETLLRDLWSRAETAGGLHWSERRAEGEYSAPQEVETTAVVLKAALALSPDDPRLAAVVRWLLRRRTGPAWVSTRDTAWILFALVDYLERSGELRPDYRYSVRLNGKEVHTEEVTPGDPGGEERVLRVPLRDLEPENRLEIRKEGRGRLYYSAVVTQAVRTPGFAAESAVPGLSVRREYFRMETRKDAEGRLEVAPQKRPTLSLRAGDRVLVRLTLEAPGDLEYLMLEDPIPAGFEVHDRGDVPPFDWQHWWAAMDVRDDRVALFIRRLARGRRTLEYYVRPEMSGRLRALPAVLSDMYDPTTRASTGDAVLDVGR